MTRPLRIEFSGALYHVTSRGDRQEDIYLDDEDRTAYLDILKKVCERFNWVVHGYCLMSNHYHLLIETPDSNLSQGMRQLNGVYTQSFNRRHKRVGHVYQGRFKAILVQKETYLLELSRYIVLNPVRAEMVRSAKDWPWSSYRATAGLTEPADFLHVDWILSVFAKRKTLASQRYRAFVTEGKKQPKPWSALKNQVFLGSDDFVDEMQCKLMPDKDLSEIALAQKRPMLKELSYYDRKYKKRDEAITAAYASGGYSMKAIGDCFKLHYSWVSRIVKARNKT